MKDLKPKNSTRLPIAATPLLRLIARTMAATLLDADQDKSEAQFDPDAGGGGDPQPADEAGRVKS